MTMFSPDNTPETLTAAGLQSPSGTQALRLESLDSALLASVLEASFDGFLLFNSELRCLSANLAACDMLGRSLENVCGQHLRTLFADQETSTHMLTRTGRWPAVVVRANEEEREVECTQAVIEQGEIIQRVLIMRDITNVRQAMREAKILTQLVTHITYTDSLETILTTFARKVVQILGIQACFITLVSGSPPQFRVLSDYGLPPGFTATMRDLAQVGARMPTLHAFEEGQIVLHNFPPNDAFYGRLFPQQRWSPEVNALLSQFLDLRLQFPGGNIASVPLLYKGTSLGVFNVYYSGIEQPDMANVSLFVSIAELAAMTIHNARQFMAVQDKAAREERRRLARELHDSVSQHLYGITLSVQAARKSIEIDAAHASESLDYALSLARVCQTEMRALLLVLRPEALESTGLAVALARHATAIGARYNLSVEINFCAEPSLSLEAKESLYRIAQEALHNIVKHAQARRITLRLYEIDAGVTLEIEDDGVGFDPKTTFTGQLGLLSMHERAQLFGGNLRIKSAPEWGTSVSVSLPALNTSALHL
ncbi:MAG TPA: histidine kinase [Ktedonobacteraceae bacterium]